MEFRVGRSEALINAGSMAEPNQGPFGERGSAID